MSKTGIRWTEEEYQEFLNKGQVPTEKKRTSKYNVAPAEERTEDGILFASKKEMEFYKQLEILQKAGEVKFFLMQCPFLLPGNIRYRIDFIVFMVNGDVRFIDTKGMETATFKMKKKQVEEIYGIKIEGGL